MIAAPSENAQEPPPTALTLEQGAAIAAYDEQYAAVWADGLASADWGNPEAEAALLRFDAAVEAGGPLDVAYRTVLRAFDGYLPPPVAAYLKRVRADDGLPALRKEAA